MNKKVWIYCLFAAFFLFFTIFISSYLNIIKYRFVILKPKENLSRSLLVALASTYDAGLMVKNGFLSSLDDKAIPEKSDLKEIRLKLQLNSIKEMASNLPTSAKIKYYNGSLLYPDGTWQNISYRFRGRNIWHWFPDKPSLRLKLSKKKPINLQRHINLVNPEDIIMIANHYSDFLADQIDVLAHDNELVRVFINDQYYGVYQMITREDENMLRLKQRMPGPIYVGDRLKTKWETDQFEISGDTDVLEKIDPMSNVINFMYSRQSPKNFENLWSNLDKKKMANWVSLLNLSGGIHTDYTHNHAYFFDPIIGKIEPITSDILGLGTLLYPGARDRLSKPYKPDYKLPINEMMNPILNVILRDPHFYDLRNKVLFDALNGFASTKSQQTYLKKIFEISDNDIKADSRKSFVMETFAGFFRMPYSNSQYDTAKKEALNWVKKRNDFLLSQLKMSNVNIKLSKKSQNITLALISVNGHSATNLNLTKLKGIQVKYDRNLNGVFEKINNDKIILYPGLKETKDFYYEQIKDRRIPNFYLQPENQNYLFKFFNVNKKELEEFLSNNFINNITSELIKPDIKWIDEINIQKIKYNNISQHSWTFKEKDLREITLGPGTINVLNNVESNSGQTINILPGTTLNLGPNVSIFANGPLKIDGKLNSKITIKRLYPKKPWGVIAIQGLKSSNSFIKFADISGGSIATNYNINYTGMVSFHNSKNILVENSHFSKNVIGDDTLRIVYGKSKLKNLTFSNCFGDCIDFDYGNANLQKIVIKKAKNDGLDFMSAAANLNEIIVNGAGDKGISVGEKSKIKLNKGDISNANIGVAVKDKSIIEIIDSKLSANQVAVDTYKKNWRYGGAGILKITSAIWNENHIDVRSSDGGVVFIQNNSSDKSLRYVNDSGKIIFK